MQYPFIFLSGISLQPGRLITSRTNSIHPQMNKKTGLALCCPVTSNIKGYPFEVLARGRKIGGVILSDHLKNLDWKVRKAKFIEFATDQVMAECIEKISVLIIQK